MGTVTVRPVHLPSDLFGQANGKLGPCQMQAVHFPGLGDASLHKLVARAYIAMCAAYHAEAVAHPQLYGVFNSFSTTGGGAYRSLQIQEREFFDRYSPTYNPLTTKLTNQRVYQGKRYFLRIGKTACAVPGTSNHGWACALDIAVFNAATHGVVGLTAAAFDWLCANAPLYGFAWESAPTLPTGQPNPEFERWHIHWTMGDTIPQKVIDVETWFAAAGQPLAA